MPTNSPLPFMWIQVPLWISFRLKKRDTVSFRKSALEISKRMDLNHGMISIRPWCHAQVLPGYPSGSWQPLTSSEGDCISLSVRQPCCPVITPAESFRDAQARTRHNTKVFMLWKVSATGRLELHKATIVEVNIIGEVEQHRALPPFRKSSSSQSAGKVCESPCRLKEYQTAPI